MLDFEIMELMKDIEYGFKDELDNNILVVDPKKYDEEFYNFYYLLSPDELMEKKCGVCFDQVELEREYFLNSNKDVKTYFISAHIEDEYPSHTFLTFEKNNKYCWFEHSWGEYRGIHEYQDKVEMLKDIKDKFIKSHSIKDVDKVNIYEYEQPPYHISCQEFYDYCEKQEPINIE